MRAFLPLLLLAGCVTALPPADALQVGMPVQDALRAMRQQPRRVTAAGDMRILHFTVAPPGALVADPEPFIIYVHQNHVVAFGHPSDFPQHPTIRHEHIITGGQTNLNIQEYRPQPLKPTTTTRKPDSRL